MQEGDIIAYASR
jgi:hypothetical protein